MNHARIDFVILRSTNYECMFILIRNPIEFKNH